MDHSKAPDLFFLKPHWPSSLGPIQKTCTKNKWPIIIILLTAAAPQSQIAPGHGLEPAYIS